MQELTARYLAELDDNPAALELRALAADRDRLTLVYSARDEHHHRATVLAEQLQASPTGQ
jgi:uncharacterized protein YeaO (DUF488 family)